MKINLRVTVETLNQHCLSGSLNVQLKTTDAAKIQEMSERHDLAAVDVYIVDLHRLIYEL